MTKISAQEQARGLVIINTGNGKGKTTAAFGQALRAAGHGLRVCIVQFIKGSWPTGEEKAIGAFHLPMEFHKTGHGFTWQSSDPGRDRAAAQEGWSLARDKVMGGQYDLIVLDELTYLIAFDMIPEQDILKVIRERPAGVHLIITGRNATAGLLETADLVTEMKDLKHPFYAGIPARKGIEF